MVIIITDSDAAKKTNLPLGKIPRCQMKFPCQKPPRPESPATPAFAHGSLVGADATGAGLVQAEVAAIIITALAQLGDDGEFH